MDGVDFTQATETCAAIAPFCTQTKKEIAEKNMLIIMNMKGSRQKTGSKTWMKWGLASAMPNPTWVPSDVVLIRGLVTAPVTPPFVKVEVTHMGVSIDESTPHWMV